MVLFQIAKQLGVGLKTFEGTGSTYRPRVTGRPRTVRTAENVALVRAAVEESPGRSARRHSLAMGMSDRSFRRILHLDLKFHPYKIMLVQELKHTDFEKRKNCSQEILNSIPEQSTFFSSDEAHFYVCGSVNKQNFAIGLKKIQENFIRDLSIPPKLQFGALFPNLE